MNPAHKYIITRYSEVMISQVTPRTNSIPKIARQGYILEIQIQQLDQLSVLDSFAVWTVQTARNLSAQIH